jgi:hypothetical protein
MSTPIAMAIEQNDTSVVMNPPVPNEPNPALPPGDYDDEVVVNETTTVDDIGYNDLADIEPAKILATKVALRESLASNGLAIVKINILCLYPYSLVKVYFGGFFVLTAGLFEYYQ